LEKGMAP